MWRYLLDRLKEPSTYAGVAAVVAVVRPEAVPIVNVASEVLVVLFGGLAVFLSERKA